MQKEITERESSMREENKDTQHERECFAKRYLKQDKEDIQVERQIDRAWDECGGIDVIEDD